MRRTTVRESARMAGQVSRYHTWPTIQTQTNADHSFHVLRIYMMVFGAPSVAVVDHIVRHDLGEIGPGDCPFPSKAENPVLKAEHDRLGDEALDRLGMYKPTTQPTEDELRKIKICDLLEMYEFGCVELAMGNTLARPIVKDTMKAVTNLWEFSEVEWITNYLENTMKEMHVG